MPPCATGTGRTCTKCVGGGPDPRGICGSIVAFRPPAASDEVHDVLDGGGADPLSAGPDASIFEFECGLLFVTADLLCGRPNDMPKANPRINRIGVRNSSKPLTVGTCVKAHTATADVLTITACRGTASTCGRCRSLSRTQQSVRLETQADDEVSPPELGRRYHASAPSSIGGDEQAGAVWV